jgi:hypothetical protein
MVSPVIMLYRLESVREHLTKYVEDNISHLNYTYPSHSDIDFTCKQVSEVKVNGFFRFNYYPSYYDNTEEFTINVSIYNK